MTRHRWMVVVPYEVTPEDARRVATGEGVPSQDEVPDTQLAGDELPAPDDPRPWFGLHNVARDLIGVACWTCEQPYTDEVAAQPCPGEPGQKLAYVDDQGRDLHPDEAIADQGAPVQFGAVGRNDPCPCGSGLKFKRCHGSRV